VSQEYYSNACLDGSCLESVRSVAVCKFCTDIKEIPFFMKLFRVSAMAYYWSKLSKCVSGTKVWDTYYNNEWFPIFSVADYCILHTLVNLPWWWLQKRWKHVG